MFFSRNIFLIQFSLPWLLPIPPHFHSHPDPLPFWVDIFLMTQTILYNFWCFITLTLVISVMQRQLALDSFDFLFCVSLSVVTSLALGILTLFCVPLNWKETRLLTETNGNLGSVREVTWACKPVECRITTLLLWGLWIWEFKTAIVHPRN